MRVGAVSPPVAAGVVEEEEEAGLLGTKRTVDRGATSGFGLGLL